MSMEDLVQPQLTIFDAVAGAGKTTQAFERAISVAKEGQRVLYTAYDVSVQREGHQRAQKLGLGNLIVSRTVHSVALEAEKTRLLKTQHPDAKLLQPTAEGGIRSPFSAWFPAYVSNQIAESVQKAWEDRNELYKFIEGVRPELAKCTYEDIETDIKMCQKGMWKLVAEHAVSAMPWPAVAESRVAAFARIFWWLLERGLVMPTYDSLLKLAVDFPDTLHEATQDYKCVILDEAHDMNDAGVAMFYELLRSRRGVVAVDQYQEIYPFEFGTSHLYLRPPPGMLLARLALQQTQRFGNPLAARVQEMVRVHFKKPLFSFLPRENRSTSITAVVDLNCLPCYPMLVLGRSYAALFFGLYRMLRHAQAPKSISWLGETKKYQQMIAKLEKYAAQDEDERQEMGQQLGRSKALGCDDDESYSLWHCVPQFGRTKDERRENVSFLIQGIKEHKSGQGCDVCASTVHQAKGSEANRVLALDGFLRDEKSRCDEHKVCYVAATRAKKELLVECPLLLDALGGPTPEARRSIDWLSEIAQRPGRAGDPRGKRRAKRQRTK